MSFFSTVSRSLFGWLPTSTHPTEPFTPQYEDICQTRAILKALKLPTELVLQILDYAEYWPRFEYSMHHDDRKEASARLSRSSHAALCLDVGIFSNPTVDALRQNGEKIKIKALCFNIDSQDQGWTSENTMGTFNTSSWLEVSILRSANGNDPRLLTGPGLLNTWIKNPSDFHEAIADRGCFLVQRPPSAAQGPQDGEGDLAWYLQGNRVACKDGTRFVVWSEDGLDVDEGAGRGEGFLQELKDGDRILIWARAKVCDCLHFLVCQLQFMLITIVSWLEVHRRPSQSYYDLRYLNFSSAVTSLPGVVVY